MFKSKEFSVDYFQSHYPITFGRIVEKGKVEIANFYISPKMKIVRFGPLFWVMYPISNGEDVVITSYYATHGNKHQYNYCSN